MKLFEHQRDALKFIAARGWKAGLFMDMRTGKSRVAVASARLAGCKRVLIVCPISACSIWGREVDAIDQHMISATPTGLVELDWLQPIASKVVDLTRCTSLDDKASMLARAGNAVVLINYESYWRGALRSAITKWKPDAVILDEAQRIRSRTTQQSKFAHKFASMPHVRVRLALSGTPIGNGLQDLWSLYRFIDPTIFGRWPEFAARYLVINSYAGFPKIERFINEDEAHAKVAETAFQYTRQDLGAPPQDIRVDVQLSSKTEAAYAKVKKEALIKLQRLDGSEATAIAKTALATILRLHQLTGGFIGVEPDFDDDSTSAADIERGYKKREIVDLSDEKVEATIELVEQARESHLQCVIFCYFLHDLDKVTMALQSKGHKVGRFDGSVVPKERAQILANFQQGMYDALAVQIRTGSLGIELSAATVAIFYSTGYSLDDFLQARARLLGPNQHRDVAYYHLIAPKTIDDTILSALQSKVSIASRATDLRYVLDLVSGG